MKNILIIQGGGRPNGNTAQLINSFIAGAKECGHSIELISLIKNEVKGCLGCNACRYGKPCIQKDSFNNLIPRIKDADCIVFASPLYFGPYLPESRHLSKDSIALLKKTLIPHGPI